MRIRIGPQLEGIRKRLIITKKKLATLSNTNIKTIYNIEKGNKPMNVETFAKIRDALGNHFYFDLEKETNIKIVWNLKDLSKDALSIMEGSLLGDGHIGKNGVYSQAARDIHYLRWFSNILKREGILSNIYPIKRKNHYSQCYSLYSHSCHAFLELRKKWYINYKNKIIKRVPKDIQINKLTLLHWYLGDGTFKRDYRTEKGGRPCVKLCTNDFIEEDIHLLLKKLKESGLRFYKEIRINKNGGKAYVLDLYVDNLINFFRLLGYKPIQNIKDCVTKTVGNKQCTLGDKWPNENDWSKILAKTPGVLGDIVREKRKSLNLSQRELGKKVNLTKHHISEIENGRKCTSLKRFNQFIEVLGLNVNDILKKNSMRSCLYKR